MKTIPRYKVKKHISRIKACNAYSSSQASLALLDRDQIDTLVATYALSRGYRYGFNGMEKDDEAKGRGNSYDFGARMYDSRLGRFLSIDASFSIKPSEGVYNFAGNSPILYIDYKGHFKWPGDQKQQEALENKYPKFTKIMQNIHKMPEMYDNLLDEMSKQTRLSSKEIVENLKYGNGAIIVISSTTQG